MSTHATGQTAPADTRDRSSSSPPPRIVVRGLTKRYGELLANDRVDLEIERGGIHAIVGENGAGKTTLMRAIYGLVQPDEGTIELDGVATRIASPADAIRLGVGMVHQRFELVDELTALENLVLGAVPTTNRVFFDRAHALATARALASRLKTKIDWDRPVANLTVGTRQRLEIMRLLYRQADILIFDEPTSVLTPQEADELFSVLRLLAGEGRTILFVTHKLREVFAVAGRVTVMRRGRVVATMPTAETNDRSLASLILGEAVVRPRIVAVEQPGEPVLTVEQLTVIDDMGELAVRDATFLVHTSEIVGIAGIEGSGQRELVEALLGLRLPSHGTVRLDGRDITRRPVWDRRRLGVAYVSEDRDNEGACLRASLADNVISLEHRRAPLSRAGVLQLDAIAAFTRGILDRFGVRGGIPSTLARNLSGGNLQRLVVGRELRTVPRVLVAAHPTRGVDVRGIAFIHEQLAGARAEGAGILLVSEELSELLELADRLLVMFEGRIAAELTPDQASPERLGLLMTGSAA